MCVCVRVLVGICVLVPNIKVCGIVNDSESLVLGSDIFGRLGGFMGQIS